MSYLEYNIIILKYGMLNYPQWIAFAKYSIAQLKWTLIKKPEMRYKYVQDILDEEWLNTYNKTESLWKEFNNG